MANLNDHDMEVLISQTERRPCLWIPSREHYKDKITKTEFWVEVYIVYQQKPQVPTTRHGFYYMPQQQKLDSKNRLCEKGLTLKEARQEDRLSGS